MTRQSAKDLVLSLEAIKQMMDVSAEAYASQVVTKIGLGDLFTYSRCGIKVAFEEGFKAGCLAVSQKEPLRPRCQITDIAHQAQAYHEAQQRD